MITNKFKPGDKVVCVELPKYNNTLLSDCLLYTICDVDGRYVRLSEDITDYYYYFDRFQNDNKYIRKAKLLKILKNG